MLIVNIYEYLFLLIEWCNYGITYWLTGNVFPLHMHAKPSFAHPLQAAKMVSSRISAQNNGPRTQKMALGCQVFHYSVKFSKHGLSGFIDVVQCRLATPTFTMLTSCWQVLSEVELRPIFDVCKQWANSSFAFICKENYGSIHEASRGIRLAIMWKSSTYPQPPFAVREPPVLASSIEIYYFITSLSKI